MFKNKIFLFDKLKLNKKTPLKKDNLFLHYNDVGDKHVDKECDRNL